MEGYAYILTHPGLPCILWEHAFDWGLIDDLKALIELRRRSGITRLGTVMILTAQDDLCAPSLRSLTVHAGGYAAALAPFWCLWC